MASKVIFVEDMNTSTNKQLQRKIKSSYKIEVDFATIIYGTSKTSQWNKTVPPNYRVLKIKLYGLYPLGSIRTFPYWGITDKYRQYLGS